MIEYRYNTMIDFARLEREWDHLEGLEDDPQDAEDLAAYDFALGEN